MQGFGGKSRRKEASWETGLRWEDGIRMDLRDVEWIQLAQYRGQWRTVVSVVNFRILAPRI
jgi:hypothetical protein